jgi:hypothetical protein
MTHTILLNNQAHYFSKADLPCLVHYLPKAGGSLYSVTLIINMFLSSSKILFLTAFPMAKDNFFNQLKGQESNISYITEEDQLDHNSQAIIIESGNEKLFLSALKKLRDISERIIFVKNIEQFGQEFFRMVLNFEKIILSGNLNKCISKNQISNKNFKTNIYFNKPEISLNFNLPKLERYTGYLYSQSQEGIIKSTNGNYLNKY